MTYSTWEKLHDKLRRCSWFTRVGQSTSRDRDPDIRRVASWADAVVWTADKNCLWCANEASNVLSLHLHVNHHREYQAWNRHVASFRPAGDALVAEAMKEVPCEFRTQSVADWIRSHITRAYLECVYSSMSDVRLACQQVEWYLLGHFPCGWIAFEEEAFPDQAITIVY